MQEINDCVVVKTRVWITGKSPAGKRQSHGDQLMAALVATVLRVVQEEKKALLFF